MGIVLAILKVIGIVLLVLLGIILLLMCCLLFVPIRYTLEGKYPEQPYFNGNISWLLHLVRVRASYEQEEFTFGIWIAMFRLPLGDEKKPRSNRNSGLKKKSEEVPKESKPKETAGSPVGETVAEKQAEVEPEPVPEKVIPVSDIEEESEDSRFEKLKQNFEEKKSKWSAIKEKISKWWTILTDESNQEAFTHVTDEGKVLLSKIAPKRMTGYANYSLGSPDYTGYLLGVLSLLPFVYDRKFSLYADFTSDELYFDGDITTRGKFRTFWILISGIRLYRDRNIRRLLQKLK